jgi:hypothetical protein
MLGQVLGDVAQLVDLAALDQGPRSERRPDRLAQPLAPVDHEQPGAVDEEPAVDQVSEQRPTDLLALGRPHGDAEDVLASRAVDAQGHQQHVVPEHGPVHQDHHQVEPLQRARQVSPGPLGRPGHEAPAYARPARGVGADALGQRLQARLIAATAHPQQDLLEDPLPQGILGGHPAPSRQLDLLAAEAPDPGLAEPDLAASEHQAPLVVAVAVCPTALQLAVARAAQGGPILLEHLGEDVEPRAQDQLAQGSPSVQDHPGKAGSRRGGRPPRGKNRFRGPGLRAILLHDGGLLSFQPDHLIGSETAVNFQRSGGHHPARPPIP